MLASDLAIDAVLLSPQFVGPRVGLHPVWLIFAVLVFGSLLGLVGILVAVPLAAAIAVLVRFAVRSISTARCTGQRRRSRRPDDATAQGQAVTGVPGQLILDLRHAAGAGGGGFPHRRLQSRQPPRSSTAGLTGRISPSSSAPPHSGKSHLANVWRLKSGATRLEAQALGEADVVRAKGALVVEDLHAGVAASARCSISSTWCASTSSPCC